MGRRALIGRGRELSVLDGVLDELDDPAGATVVLLGEPGMGKTALLDAMADDAASRGVTVLRGQSPPLGSNLPFGPIAGAIARHLDAVDDHERTRLTRDLPALGRLVDGIAAPEGRADPDTERLHLFQSVVRLLGRASAPGPVLLVIDDVHWSDAATVELLEHLVAELASVPVGIVLSLREGELDERPAVRRMVRSLRGGRRSTTLDLGPLDDASARELASRLMGPGTDERTLDDVVARSAGLPLAIEAIAESVREGSAVTVPGFVVDLFRDRIGRLHEHHRAVLATVASAQVPVSAIDVASVMADAEVAVIDALRHLERRQLVRRADPGPDGSDRHEPRHGLIADGCLQDLGEGGRRALHAGWMIVMERAGMPVEIVALHAAAAGDALPGRDAARVLGTAGRAALATGAADSAARWLAGEVAALRRDGVDGEALAQALVDLGAAWDMLGEFAASRAAIAEAADLLAELDPARASALLSRAALVDWLRGSHGSLDQFGERSIRLAERSGSAAALVHARSERHHMLARQRRLDDMAREMAHLRATLDPDGPDGRTAVWIAELVEACFASRAIDTALDRRPPVWMGASTSLRRTAFGLSVEAASLLGRWDEVERLLHAGPAPTDPLLRTWRPTVARIDHAWSRGDWDEADRLLDEFALGAADRFAIGRELLRARGLGHRGDREGVAELIASADRRMDAAPALRSTYRSVRAAVIVDALPPDERDRYDVREQDFDVGWEAMWEPMIRVGQGWWLADRGQETGARQTARRLRDRGGPGSRPDAQGMQIEGLAERRRDPRRARASMLDAAHVFRSLGQHFDAARTVVEACEAHPEPDDDRLLVPELGLFDQLGAAPWSARGRALLGDRSRVGRAELTRREREVALLVAEGRSNAQVAEELGISIRTVTSHLDHAYTKLGIGSRAALAAYVTRDVALTT